MWFTNKTTHLLKALGQGLDFFENKKSPVVYRGCIM
jgi:hypothetical protein